MKNKGFTLIELLAVIVILAIIALIATPIVLNIIKDSKNSSIERSAELYLDQVKNEIARYNMIHPGSNFNPSECIVQSDNTLNCDGTIVAISIDGTKPNSGSTILLSNGKVYRTKKFIIDSTELFYQAGRMIKGSDVPLCKAVKNLSTQSYCPSNTYCGSPYESNLVYEKVGILASDGDPYAYGVEYNCSLGNSATAKNLTFYVIDKTEDTVSLILNSNISKEGYAMYPGYDGSSNTFWISAEDYKKAGGDLSNDNGKCQHGGYCYDGRFGGITALKYLNNATTHWNYLLQSQISLPTVNQITALSNDTTKELPKYLILNIGYSYYFVSGPINNDYAYGVDYSLKLTSHITYMNWSGAVRPVITLDKSDIQ